jgi:hypothetical protein
MDNAFNLVACKELFSTWSYTLSAYASCRRSGVLPLSIEALKELGLTCGHLYALYWDYSCGMLRHAHYIKELGIAEF